MLRLFFRIIAVLVLLAVLVLGIEFSTINSDPVNVNYFADSPLSVPLSLVVVSAFAVGAALTLLVCISVMLRQRWRIRRLQREVSALARDLSNAPARG